MRLIIVSFAGGFGVVAAILLLAFATGSTFGQRCARAYPQGGIEVERCVYALSRGERP